MKHMADVKGRDLPKTKKNRKRKKNKSVHTKRRALNKCINRMRRGLATKKVNAICSTNKSPKYRAQLMFIVDFKGRFGPDLRCETSWKKVFHLLSLCTVLRELMAQHVMLLP